MNEIYQYLDIIHKQISMSLKNATIIVTLNERYFGVNIDLGNRFHRFSMTHEEARTKGVIKEHLDKIVKELQ